MSKSHKMYKNVYYVAVSGMREGISKETWESYYVGARSEKQALDIIKKQKGKTNKYRIRYRSKEDMESLGIPKIRVGSVIGTKSTIYY